MARSGSPARSSARVARSHSSLWRRLSVRWLAPRRCCRPRKAPPASISGSWQGSPTSTTLVPAASAWARSRASLRVPTIAASSTTSTVVSSSAVLRRSMPARRRSMVAAGMPASSWSCLAARAARRAADHPVTRMPPTPSRAAARAKVLPAPATPSTISTPSPRRADRSHHPLLLLRQRRSRRDGQRRRAIGTATPARSSWRSSGGVEQPGLDLEHLGGRPAVLVGAGGDDGAVLAADDRGRVVDRGRRRRARSAGTRRPGRGPGRPGHRPGARCRWP